MLSTNVLEVALIKGSRLTLGQSWASCGPCSCGPVVGQLWASKVSYVVALLAKCSYADTPEVSCFCTIQQSYVFARFY